MFLIYIQVQMVFHKKEYLDLLMIQQTSIYNLLYHMTLDLDRYGTRLDDLQYLKLSDNHKDVFSEQVDLQ